MNENKIQTKVPTLLLPSNEKGRSLEKKNFIVLINDKVSSGSMNALIKVPNGAQGDLV